MLLRRKRCGFEALGERSMVIAPPERKNLPVQFKGELPRRGLLFIPRRAA
jgi:hypothetical protein